MYHAGPAEKSDGHTHTRAHTDVDTLTRTTEISSWLGWPILLTFGAELSTGADAKKISQEGSRGGSIGNPVHASQNAVCANCIDSGLKPMSQPSCLCPVLSDAAHCAFGGEGLLPASQICCEVD